MDLHTIPMIAVLTRLPEETLVAIIVTAIVATGDAIIKYKLKKLKTLREEVGEVFSNSQRTEVLKLPSTESTSELDIIEMAMEGLTKSNEALRLKCETCPHKSAHTMYEQAKEDMDDQINKYKQYMELYKEKYFAQMDEITKLKSKVIELQNLISGKM